MKTLFLILLLPCLPARAGVAPVSISVPELATKPLEAATIAKAIDLYNRAHVNPTILGGARLSVHLWVTSQDGKSVEPREIPALLERGASVVIKHDALLMMDGGQARLLRSPSRPISTVEQLRQWAERARSSNAGDFSGALDKASAAK